MAQEIHTPETKLMPTVVGVGKSCLLRRFCDDGKQIRLHIVRVARIVLWLKIHSK